MQGFAYILFQIPEDAVKAYEALDMNIFQVSVGIASQGFSELNRPFWLPLTCKDRSLLDARRTNGCYELTFNGNLAEPQLIPTCLRIRIESECCWFQGRLLHILPAHKAPEAEVKAAPGGDDGEGGAFKKQREAQRKADAGDS